MEVSVQVGICAHGYSPNPETGLPLMQEANGGRCFFSCTLGPYGSKQHRRDSDRTKPILFVFLIVITSCLSQITHQDKENSKPK
jgi:hypothetical protein